MIFINLYKLRFIVKFSNFVRYLETDLKKTLYISLLVLLIMQSGGLFVVLKMQQYTAKAIMHNQIRRSGNDIQHLRLCESDYNKCIVDNKEIYYKGKRYDVVCLTKAGDSIDMSVIHDEKEGNVVKRMKDFFAKSDDGSKKTPQELIRLLTLDYLQTAHPDISIVFYPFTTYKSPFIEGLIMRNTEVFLPPPELV